MSDYQDAKQRCRCWTEYLKSARIPPIGSESRYLNEPLVRPNKTRLVRKPFIVWKNIIQSLRTRRLLGIPGNPTSYLISTVRARRSSSSSSSSRNSLFDPRKHQTTSSRAHSTATVFGIKSAFKRYHSSKNREKLNK